MKGFAAAAFFLLIGLADAFAKDPIGSIVYLLRGLSQYAAPVVIAIVVMSVRVSRIRRKYRRLNERLCFTCGYDANGTSLDCPRCGRPFGEKALNVT